MHDHEKKHHDKAVTEKPQEEVSIIDEAIKAYEPRPKLAGAYQTLKKTFNTWKNHWKVFTGIQVVWAAVFLAVMVIGLAGSAFFAALSGAFDAVTNEAQLGAALIANPALLGGMLLGALVAIAVIIVASTWMSLATIRAWQWVVKEDHASMSVRNAYATTWSLVPRYIWITILAGALMVLGFFGFFIPGLLLALAFALLPSVVLTEGLAGRHAIMRTTRLAHPYLPTIFWRMLVAGVIIYVPSEIVTWILNEISNGLGDAIGQMYGLVVGPIFTGVLYATYLEIKAVERKAPHTTWMSLERLALLGAVGASIVVLAMLVFSR